MRVASFHRSSGILPGQILPGQILPGRILLGSILLGPILLLGEGCFNIDCDTQGPCVCTGTNRNDTAEPNPCDPADERTWYADADGDGYGDEHKPVVDCTPPSGHVANSSDCNDDDNGIHPGADETCDTEDLDCDGLADAGAVDAPTWYYDGDGDGHGDKDVPWTSCVAPAGHVEDDQDCDDGDPDIHPHGPERCENEKDDDCDGETDEGCEGGPVCGDDEWVNPYEECDGDEDYDCSGQCSAHCACPAQEPGDLELHFIDVDHGDAIVVRSPAGFVMMLDTGDWSEDHQDVVEGYLYEHGFDSLDYFLASHMHADHIAGVSDLVDTWSDTVACFVHGFDYGSATYEETFLEDEDVVGRTVVLNRGDVLDLAGAGTQRFDTGLIPDTGDTGGATGADPVFSVEVLHPDPEDVSDNENDNSIVLRLEYGDFSALLGGDCEQACEEHLLETDQVREPVTLYKVHHHGSDSSSTEPLLDVLQPELAVVSASAGDLEDYAEPLSAIEGYVGQGNLYHTASHGHIQVTTDGRSWSVTADAR